MVLWIEKLYNIESKTFWRQLADNVVTVTPGWSEAYGLFIEGEVDGVLSYTTSPAYHKVAENDNTKVAAVFDEGHLMQIEVGAILENSEKILHKQHFSQLFSKYFFYRGLCLSYSMFTRPFR